MLFEEKSRIRDKNILHFCSAWLMLWVCFLCNSKCNGQEQEFTTFCNPINIDYQFNIDTTWFTGRNLWREAADPVIVTYKGDYYLFASKAGGYWYSNDLSTWIHLMAAVYLTLHQSSKLRQNEGTNNDEICESPL